MTTFRGGPLGQFTLLLKRSPDYLRAAADGPKRDALDLTGDEPAPGETLYAYRRVGQPGDVHLRIRRGWGDPNNVSGWYRVAEYEYVAEQPDQATMRDTAAWRAWCYERQAKDAGDARD